MKKGDAVILPKLRQPLLPEMEKMKYISKIFSQVIHHIKDMTN